MNKSIITGRFVADPELRTTQSGISVIRFTIAVNRPKQKGKDSEADFIKCVAWRQTADFISKYFQKGDPIEIEGSLRVEKYQDKKYEDVTHYETYVLVDHVEFTLSKKNDGNGSGSSTGGDLSDFEEIIGADEDPF